MSIPSPETNHHSTPPPASERDGVDLRSEAFGGVEGRRRPAPEAEVAPEPEVLSGGQIGSHGRLDTQPTLHKEEDGELARGGRLQGLSPQEIEELRQWDREHSADQAAANEFGDRDKRYGPLAQLAWSTFASLGKIEPEKCAVNAEARAAMDQCVAVLKRHVDEGTLKDEQGKISRAALRELSDAGYFALAIPRGYGGYGASFHGCISFLNQEIAPLSATICGIWSVRCCIGAVRPLMAFGTDQQKEKFLPELAAGRPSFFALTEKPAGSNPSAIETTVTDVGDAYEITGEKVFITGPEFGACGVVVAKNKATGKTNLYLVELPKAETENFKFFEYDLIPLCETYNRGMVFKNFRIPKENLITAPKLNPETGAIERKEGEGMKLAYGLLNYGRVAVAANAGGALRQGIHFLDKWVKGRGAIGGDLSEHQQIQVRIGEMAARAVACDLLAHYGAALIDNGYRAEAECIVAKVMGSELAAQAGQDQMYRTQGGRALIRSNFVFQLMLELKAMQAYEGETTVLEMKASGTNAAPHLDRYLRPLAEIIDRETKRVEKRAQSVGKTDTLKIELSNPLGTLASLAKHPMAALRIGAQYGIAIPKLAAWHVGRRIYNAVGPTGQIPEPTPLAPPHNRRFGSEHAEPLPTKISTDFKPYAKYAMSELRKMGVDVAWFMATRQAKALKEEGMLVHFGERMARLQTMVILAAEGSKISHPFLKQLALASCEELYVRYEAPRPTRWQDVLKYNHQMAEIGKKVLKGEFPGLEDIRTPEMTFEYPSLLTGQERYKDRVQQKEALRKR